MFHRQAASCCGWVALEVRGEVPVHRETVVEIQRHSGEGSLFVEAELALGAWKGEGLLQLVGNREVVVDHLLGVGKWVEPAGWA